MFCNSLIIGKLVDLKSVDESDAEFTMSIRNEPAVVQFLPRLTNTIEQQKEWIRKQRITNGDYFWVLLDKKGNRFGTIGVYDVNTNTPQGRSLAALGNPLQNIEGVYLAYKYIFEELSVSNIYGWVYEDNIRAIRFDELLGGTIGKPREVEGRVIRDIVFNKAKFNIAGERIRKMIYR